MAQTTWEFKFPEMESTVRWMRSMRGVTGITSAVARAVYGVAEEVMTRAKELCPVDTGALKSTGNVSQPVVKGTEVNVKLSFGGVSGVSANGKYVGYAVHVHENRHARHRTGQWKYLETPLLEAMPRVAARVAEELEKLKEEKR